MDSLAEILRRLDQLNVIGVSLSSERNLDHLLETILLAAKAITRADACTLYRMNAACTALRFAIVRNDSLDLKLGGSASDALDARLDDLPLYRHDADDTGSGSPKRPNNAMVAAWSALNTKTVNIADAYVADGFDFSGTRAFDQATGYRSQSFLTVPLKSHDDQVIGVLQLINAIDPASGRVRAFSDADQRLAESLASQAAIALSNRLLVDQTEHLFESFIALINLAVDEKSPYTSGHSQRMQELTMMLATAAAASEEGELAAFTMNDEERHELKIAALLHDCGKVATPQHVVDKASRLQTVFDRIDLIDTRFAMIRRDAEINALRAIIGGSDKVSADATLQKALAAIDADNAFLRQANGASIVMREADQTRVRQISQRYRWRDKLGNEHDFLTDDELENFCIPHGTLTVSERETINSHIVTTIRMLESLPWPKHLRHVTEYAGGHHERIDGSGYPKGLKRHEMPVAARIMAIADIFEALTAGDRPYKAALKLSDALRILGKMCDNGHVDPDLYRVFIERRIYLDYAQRFLPPTQNDVVD